MIRTYFRLRPGEPRDLELTQGAPGSISPEKNFILAVRWKGVELGRFVDRNSLLQEQNYTLEDGGQLSVRLASSGWGMPYRVQLNGVPIADRGVRDGFDQDASDLGSSCWLLILWPFYGTAIWVVLLSLGLVQSGTVSALGMQGEGGIPWNVFLPRLINYRFNVQPFGEILFSSLSVGLICLGVVLLVMSRLMEQRKVWTIYPGLLIH